MNGGSDADIDGRCQRLLRSSGYPRPATHDSPRPTRSAPGTTLAGFAMFSRWENGENALGSDFRDNNGGDLEPNGGSDVPDILIFTGHGPCREPTSRDRRRFHLGLAATSAPRIGPISARSRAGQTGQHLKFCFLDASCPMDLISLGQNWFPAFRGSGVNVGRFWARKCSRHARQCRSRRDVRRIHIGRLLLLPSHECRRRLDGDGHYRHPGWLLRSRHRCRREPRRRDQSPGN